MHPQYESVAAQAFADSDARSDRLLRLLAEPDELVGLTLRGHLVLEELLFAACAAHCQDMEQLKSARLRFPQLVSLLRALEKIPAAPPHFWAALLELNILRNALAHRLEAQDVEARIQRLVETAQLPPPAAPQEVDASPREQLKRVLYYLVGGFEVVAVWQRAVEILMSHEALKPTSTR